MTEDEEIILSRDQAFQAWIKRAMPNASAPVVPLSGAMYACWMASWEACNKARQGRAARRLLAEGRGPVKKKDPEITQRYETVKKLVEAGYSIKDACMKVDLSPDSYYRRQRMEKTGRDRSKARDYQW